VPGGGEALNIEIQIIVPDERTPADFNGRTFRVVHLKNSHRVLLNKAVDITILSGKHNWFHDSHDARPFVSWLGVPIGATFIALGHLLFYYGKDDAESAASDGRSLTADRPRCPGERPFRRCPGSLEGPRPGPPFNNRPTLGQCWTPEAGLRAG
jgi:hypothetical protein